MSNYLYFCLVINDKYKVSEFYLTTIITVCSLIRYHYSKRNRLKFTFLPSHYYVYCPKGLFINKKCQIKTIQNGGGKTHNIATSNFGVLSVNINNLKRHIAHNLPFRPTVPPPLVIPKRPFYLLSLP